MRLSQGSGTPVAEFIRHSQFFKQAILAKKIDKAKQKISGIRSITVNFQQKKCRYSTNLRICRRACVADVSKKSTEGNETASEANVLQRRSFYRSHTCWLNFSISSPGKLKERKRLLRRPLVGSNLFLKIIL